MTQHEKILKHMATEPDRWWLPQDFMRPELGELFVGYEASARLSELAKLYPDKIESRRQGKYMARRLIIANGISYDGLIIDEAKDLPEQQAFIEVPKKPKEIRMM